MALTITPPFVLPTPLEHARLGPMTIPVSATLAANENMDARRRRGEPVLPLAFGEAGLPVHETLRAALARAAGFASYGPVAGHAVLREAAACYWARRGLPTEADSVVCGPGSKALLRRHPAQLGQLRRPGQPGRPGRAFRARLGRGAGRGPASPGGDGGAGGRKPRPFGSSDAP